MSQRLVYVIGPSGAGKDSVLNALRQTWPAPGNPLQVHWARRTITRPVQTGDEQHEPLDVKAFDQLRVKGAFGLHWQANAMHYGIRTTELLEPLAHGRCVLVNGSRGHLPTVLAQWPDTTVVHVSAPLHVLAQRLTARGRETAEAIAARLQREVDLALPANHIAVTNDQGLQEAADMLGAQLNERLRSTSHRNGFSLVGQSWPSDALVEPNEQSGIQSP